jgi:hypothetical protein
MLLGVLHVTCSHRGECHTQEGTHSRAWARARNPDAGTLCCCNSRAAADPHLEVQRLAGAPQATLARAEAPEVLCRPGDHVWAQLHDHAAQGLSLSLHVKPDAGQVCCHGCCCCCRSLVLDSGLRAPWRSKMMGLCVALQKGAAPREQYGAAEVSGRRADSLLGMGDWCLG